MENNNNATIIDESDEFIEDRGQQKELVHPYRKYQLSILLSLLLIIIFSTILYKQNKKLEEYLTQKDIAFSTLQNIDKQSKGISQLLEIVDVNYKLINNLDQKRNINIIKKPSEIYFLSSLINDKSEITYKVCYKSSIDGQSPETYYNNCNHKSPLVFLIETNQGYRFGAFVSTSFIFYESDEDIYIQDKDAFIFSFDTYKKYEIRDNLYAACLNNKRFPWFGKKDIYIGENFMDNPSSFSEFPTAYKRDRSDEGDYILNGGIKKFVIKELEVVSVYIWT